jgi:hypothetical protein
MDTTDYDFSKMLNLMKNIVEIIIIYHMHVFDLLFSFFLLYGYNLLHLCPIKSIRLKVKVRVESSQVI